MSARGSAEERELGGALRTWQQHHTGLVVADFAAAVRFYREMLGFELAFEVRGMAEQFARTVGVPGVSCDLAQLWNARTRSPVHLNPAHAAAAVLGLALPVHVGIAHTAYLVEDLGAAAELIERAGGSMLGEIVEFSEGPAAYFRTPGGTVIEIEEPHDPAPEGGE